MKRKWSLNAVAAVVILSAPFVSSCDKNVVDPQQLAESVGPSLGTTTEVSNPIRSFIDQEARQLAIESLRSSLSDSARLVQKLAGQGINPSKRMAFLRSELQRLESAESAGEVSASDECEVDVDCYGIYFLSTYTDAAAPNSIKSFTQLNGGTSTITHGVAARGTSGYSKSWNDRRYGTALLTEGDASSLCRQESDGIRATTRHTALHGMSGEQISRDSYDGTDCRVEMGGA